MIQFHCTECQKAIGVDEKYAGRLIRCPGCQQPTAVPDPSSEVVTAAVVEPTPASNNVFPRCPSCQSELFSGSDVMCGICGHLLDQTSSHATPNRGQRTSPALRDNIPVAASFGGQNEPDMLTNPAVSASQYSDPAMGQFNAYDPSFANEGSSGGSPVGAWFVSVGVGLFVALIWGVIASFTGVVGQAFAWVIGAIVGLIAGLIARNSSLKFCLATTAGALLCILFGRIVSAWVITIAVSSMSVFQGLGTYLIPDTGVTVGVTEDMSIGGEFEGDEKALADMKVDAFFSNQMINEMDGYDDIDFEVEVDVDRKVRAAVGKMTDEERDAVLKRVRQDYPGWMEEDWHLEAVIDSMVANDEIEDEDLLTHAKSRLSNLDGGYDEVYYENTTQMEMMTRGEKLEELAMKKYATMTPQERQKAIADARANHPSWTPRRDEYLAMMSKMYDADTIPAEYRDHAKSTISLELSYDYDETMLEESDLESDGYLTDENALQAVVNKELLKLNQDEIDAIVEVAREKYPYWTPEDDIEAIVGLASGIDETIAGFESDGTFWSSLKTRFKSLDYVWLLLGMISAFVIAKLLGQSNTTDEEMNSAAHA